MDWKSAINLEVDQLVLLKDGYKKFQDWKLGRILKTYKVDDSPILVFDLKTLIVIRVSRKNCTRVVLLPFFVNAG